MIRSWLGHDLVMISSWFAHYLVMIWSWFGHDLVMTWSRFGHDLVMIWSLVYVTACLKKFKTFKFQFPPMAPCAIGSFIHQKKRNWTKNTMSTVSSWFSEPSKSCTGKFSFFTSFLAKILWRHHKWILKIAFAGF